LPGVNGPHHLLLVPGFFGFANLGDFAYFGHVRDYLSEIAPALGIRGEVRVVATIPTASLSVRAARLVDSIAELVDAQGGTVSVIGHSSGGLDARLVVTPDVSLPSPRDVERYARAVRSVVSISAPHHGTPVAHLFNSLLGQQLLRLLSVLTIYVIRAGRLPIRVGLRVARLLRRGQAPGSLVEQLLHELLADFSRDRRVAIESFFSSLGKDQALVGQITPGAMDVFNAATQDRPGVRYGCVVTRARPPGIRSAIGAGISPYAQTTHAVYVALYRIASRTPAAHQPRLTRAQAAILRRAYGWRTDVRANDGMVPTLSQVRGDVIHAAWADHLDVIGHFHLPTRVPPHFDWLTSGSGFDRAQFEQVWREVAAYVAAGA
jgi:triacylglycerol lipase